MNPPSLPPGFLISKAETPSRQALHPGHGDPTGESSQERTATACTCPHPTGAAAAPAPPTAPAGGRLRGPPLPGTTHLRGTGAAGGGASSRRRSGSPCCRLFPCSRGQTAPRRLPPLLRCPPASSRRDSPYRRGSARLTSPTPPFCFALLYLT